MAGERLEDQLKTLIVDRLMMTIKPAQIADEDDLMKKWKIDSVRIMEIVVGLEETFGINVADEDFGIGNFVTVKNMAAFVTRRMENK